MCLYDEHDTGTGIHALILFLVCAWVFLDMLRKVTRVPKTYLSLAARTESKAVVAVGLLDETERHIWRHPRRTVLTAALLASLRLSVQVSTKVTSNIHIASKAP